ncbi:MAG: hypothetical protein SF028_03660 [Candidatus Sumerlaeia bacterium]|nr:hypothetical protein [Candidatus Sumerlaeia bacterium]
MRLRNAAATTAALAAAALLHAGGPVKVAELSEPLVVRETLLTEGGDLFLRFDGGGLAGAVGVFRQGAPDAIELIVQDQDPLPTGGEVLGFPPGRVMAPLLNDDGVLVNVSFDPGTGTAGQGALAFSNFGEIKAFLNGDTAFADSARKRLRAKAGRVSARDTFQDPTAYEVVGVAASSDGTQGDGFWWNSAGGTALRPGLNPPLAGSQIEQDNRTFSILPLSDDLSWFSFIRNYQGVGAPNGSGPAGAALDLVSLTRGGTPSLERIGPGEAIDEASTVRVVPDGSTSSLWPTPPVSVEPLGPQLVGALNFVPVGALPEVAAVTVASSAFFGAYEADAACDCALVWSLGLPAEELLARFTRCFAEPVNCDGADYNGDGFTSLEDLRVLDACVREAISNGPARGQDLDSRLSNPALGAVLFLPGRPAPLFPGFTVTGFKTVAAGHNILLASVLVSSGAQQREILYIADSQRLRLVAVTGQNFGDGEITGFGDGTDGQFSNILPDGSFAFTAQVVGTGAFVYRVSGSPLPTLLPGEIARFIAGRESYRSTSSYDVSSPAVVDASDVVGLVASGR